MNRATQHSQRAAELEHLLATVKTRVQDLEDRCLGKAVQQLSHSHQLQQENLEVQVGKLRIIFQLFALNIGRSKSLGAISKETVSDSGAEAVQTEGGNGTASEETVFLH